ncbi:hypothetical protein MUO14_22040 [Halobacillus shinanisalinarum]|uniref:Peptidyl-prolyl cis-trans isomerase n=1 Tax=Halobacillus shinanisalinarum TaxID=2932258 RepID=A0ABY4GYF6_9BACI|nr:hypothetical protein [Halobacillus shinanisalinarum]UOQ93046.1 hypothetical protein MUO14_22040 [Halobacillus shinanisalinarum]
MIVQLSGQVKFPITLDPTVWIFDDRKLTYDEVFNGSEAPEQEEAEDELKRKSLRFDREVYQQKINPPVNKSLTRAEKERIKTETFLMPLQPFIHTSEPDPNVKKAVLVTDNGDHSFNADDLSNALLLFSIEGKPLKENGPVHLYFEDGSNKEAPITGIKKIIFE